MARRRRDKTWDQAELVIRLGIGLLVLGALSIGGITGFAEALKGLLGLVLIAALSIAALAILFLICRHFLRRQSPSGPTASQAAPGWRDLASRPLPASARTSTGVLAAELSEKPHAPAWTAATIREALNRIDWYQFEKFCAALLRADGFNVERKGGAQPDGGVDLVVEKDGARALIQCKHWRTWTVQEKVVREMLGSMTHFGVKQGAIYTLKGWSQPAARFAAEHDITLVNGDELAQSAALQLSGAQLDTILDTSVHHCPRCEAPMIERKSAFGSFWGCSTYPRCRAKLKHAGAR